MSDSLPLTMLIELARNRTDASTRRLGELLRAQTGAAEKLDMLLQYRQEYCDRMQARARDGVSSAHWRNFQHFISTLNGAIEQQRALMAHADARLVQGRGEWQRNTRRLNAFGTLAERVRQQEALALGKREQRESDERVAGQRRVRASSRTN